MRLLYIANIRLPTEKAHGAQIMKACEAFVRAGVETELVVPNRKTPIREDAFAYYDLKTRFPLTRLFTPDTIQWGKLGFIFQSLIFGLRVARYVRTEEGILYGRDEIVLAVVAFFSNKKIYWESHDGAWNICARYLARHAHGMVVVTKGARDFYMHRGVPANHIFAVPNGIDLEDFSHSESKQAARERLGLPQDKKIVMYIGALDGWKGTDTLFDASQGLPNEVLVAVIGGREERVAELKKQHPHIAFLGAHPFSELANNQAAADILVLPNTAKSQTSTTFTSPLKLFSYMASGKPIIVSDLPSIREIVDDESAVFFEADNPRSLTRAITDVARDLTTPSRVAQRARAEIHRYTWENRARSILSFLDTPDMKDTAFYNRESSQYSRKRYTKRSRTYLQYFYKHRLAITQRYITQILMHKKNPELLEIGCADGVVIRAIEEQFPNTFTRLTGVDIAPGMIEEARGRNTNPRAVFHLRSEYQPHLVDVLVETGVINYSSVEMEFEFVSQILKQDGYYILSIAGTGSLYNRIKHDTLKDFRSYYTYDRLIRSRFHVLRVRGSGLFIPLIWRVPLIALPLQYLADNLASILAPGLCHEKVYLLRRK